MNSTERLQPGPTGQPLPPGEWVLRLAIASKDLQETGQISPEVFAFSTADRRGDPPRLSVWAERLTRPEEAWLLMGGKPGYQLALRLSVDAIRSLRPNPASPEIPHLDVQWHTLLNDDGSRDTRPGADGHAGISGLHTGSSTQRKSLRRRLAQLASGEVRWIHPETVGVEEDR